MPALRCPATRAKIIFTKSMLENGRGVTTGGEINCHSRVEGGSGLIVSNDRFGLDKVTISDPPRA